MAQVKKCHSFSDTIQVHLQERQKCHYSSETCLLNSTLTRWLMSRKKKYLYNYFILKWDRTQVDGLTRRIPVPPGNRTKGQLLRSEIDPGAYQAAHPGTYRAGHSGVSVPYYGSTQDHLELP
ncbi:hypothetical protein J6590_065795 [Homalodisca vitripennis]|nr:hypothetical protein J6590_065795 [Homalodisca vitripennis]